jgi:hypothetical protein
MNIGSTVATKEQCSRSIFGGQSNANTHFNNAYYFLITKKYLFA